MASWLITILVFGAIVKGIDNAAHAGGAIAGAVIALLWRRGIVYSQLRKTIVLALCGLVLVLSTARVVWFDLAVPFSTYTFVERLQVARRATLEGDCVNAHKALDAARRLDPDAPELVPIGAAIADRCSGPFGG
jgi:hypothetical protein